MRLTASVPLGRADIVSEISLAREARSDFFPSFYAWARRPRMGASRLAARASPHTASRARDGAHHRALRPGISSGVLTEGIFPTADCLKFAVSKGLVRRARRRPDPAPRRAPNPPLRATPLVAPAP